MSIMRTGLVISCVLLILTLIVTGSPSAENPRKINYQGKLTDSGTGSPLAGSHEATFRIYDDLGAGSLLWSESQTLSADSGGIFSVILGSVTPIDVSFGGPAWLEVEVDGEILSPRREMVSVPFAFHAMNSDSLGGAPANFYWTAATDGPGSGLDADMVDGLGSGAFSDTGHVHDGRYYTQDSLSTDGTLNDAANPVAWTKLKGVPGGLADGVDDVGGLGDGHSLDAADGIPVDAVYVDNEGSVGIGTSSPSKRLHLIGDNSGILIEAGTSDPEIMLSGEGESPSDAWKLYKETGTGEFRIMRDVDRVTIGYGTGNVGIGMTTASERLDVVGSINLSEYLKFGTTTVLSVDGPSNTFVGEGAGVNTAGPLGQKNTFVGSVAGYLNSAGSGNVFVGDSSGYSNTDGSGNVFVGGSAGNSNSTGSYNTFLGALAGEASNDADGNTFLGASAGLKTIDGGYNTFVGEGAGGFNEGGENNTYVGQAAGSWNDSGSRNTFLGTWAGGGNHGDGNVFLGYRAGVDESGSDKLYIANGPDPGNVLIYGDFSTGNLGFGTLDPERRLHISSPTSSFGMMFLENSNAGSNEASLGFKPGSDATGADIWVAGVGSWGETGDFVIGKAEPKVVIRPGGEMGIGETEPRSDLTIGSNIPGTSPDAGIPSLTLGNAGGGSVITLGSAAQNYVSMSWYHDQYCRVLSTHGIRFGVGFYGPGSYTDVVIDPDGRVGIGTEDPDRDLHIVGNNPRILLEAGDVSPEINFKHFMDASSDVWAIYKDGPTEDLRFYQGGDKIWIRGGTGNVGIGVDPGANKLYVNGLACGTSSWAICSDLKFKRDIRDVARAIDKVMSLRGVSFLWRTEEHADKNFDSGRHYGVIAQETERVLPEVVRQGNDGERLVAYSEIVPVLVEAIKTQQKTIEALEERIAGLESRADTE
ncbi:tail fiber domain-containing protein [Candidatus Eisenbacteria bacterium]|uniref:Tail fiber domain-containing protein n=1 Tax=Eiseniibacteriota bacterium TaxID=2212470 RepID=A0ABV6YNH5_UNCEI